MKTRSSLRATKFAVRTAVRAGTGTLGVVAADRNGDGILDSCTLITPPWGPHIVIGPEIPRP